MSLPTFSGATDAYRADRHVTEVVNLAIRLQRPLLVEGEPGCGKTMLAKAIADDLDFFFERIMVKSTSQARDLLYRHDGLRRFQDAHGPDRTRAQSVYPYLSLGPLGRAIHRDRRSVVLIDEIDKADIDFPNDLLDVLDTFTFQIDDLPPDEEAKCLGMHGFGREVASKEKTRPIVVITSNREKQLPEPVLRRCLYVHLAFPDKTKILAEIVRKNLGAEASGKLDEDLLGTVIDRFVAIREQAVAANAQKAPATSELIDWVRILSWQEVDAADFERPMPPHVRTLFKTRRDLTAFEKAADEKEKADEGEAGAKGAADG